MNRINVLPSEIYNKISAGEVVERPANVVKELVENSLDAGATKIVVEILGGGTEKIVVSDNGQGINPDDIEKAVLNHATSKITSVSDLYNISTLGFRGEALASITSVSDVTISTKTDESTLGTKAAFKNGVLESKSEVGLPTGTTIEVSGLFKYLPARLKFLKTEKTEEQEVYNVFTKFILSNPSISFKLVIENKVKIDYFGATLTDAINEIYGNNISNNLIAVENLHNGILVKGVVGRPSTAKPSKSNQIIFVNNRYVTNQTISFAVERVFENYLMKGMHPFYVINVSLDPSLIDVNVHPKKLEVRFSDPTKIFSAVYGAVNNAILDDSAKSDLKASEPVEKIKLTPREHVASEKTYNFDFGAVNTASLKKDDESGYKYESPVSFSDFNFKEPEYKVSSSQVTFQDYIKSELPETEIKDEVKSLEQKINVLGQIFNEFCLVSKGETLYIIDEHAMHERILFDKFSAEENAKKLGTMEFLEPFMLTLNPAEEKNLVNLEADLKALGFEVSNFYKNTYRVDAIPTLLNGISLKTFFNKILSSEFLAGDKASLIKDKLAREACRAAVKAGKSLTTYEIEELIGNLKQGTPLLCPHGRPVIIELTKLDLEKMFKRKL